MRHHCLLSLVAVVCLSVSGSLAAQEKSVNPGINESFQNPDVDSFVERFEREGVTPSTIGTRSSRQWP